MEAVRSAAEHKVVDVFALLILHFNNIKKPVESLIRNKVRAGHFTELLLVNTFTGHAEVSANSLTCYRSTSIFGNSFVFCARNLSVISEQKHQTMSST